MLLVILRKVSFCHNSMNISEGKEGSDRSLRFLCKFWCIVFLCFVNVKILSQILLSCFLLVDIQGLSTLLFLIICVMDFNTQNNLILKQLSRMEIAHKFRRCLITMKSGVTKKEKEQNNNDSFKTNKKK